MDEAVAVAGEEPVQVETPVDAVDEQPADGSAPVDPAPQAEAPPELTPGTITLITGQTESVADLAAVDAALTGGEKPEWLALTNQQGRPVRVRGSAIIRYQ